MFTCSHIIGSALTLAKQLVALSEWGPRSDRERSDAAGFSYHWVKPVNIARLTQILATLPTTKGSES